MKRMHRSHSRSVIAVLLVLCLVLPLFGCADQGDVEFDNDLNLLSTSGVSIFRVVCAQDAYPAEIPEAAVRVQGAMSHMLGVEVSLVDDRDSAEAPDLVMPYEVLIGRTARRETQDVLATLGQDEWTVRMVGHKIVVLGETNRATLAAVDYFVETILGYKGDGTTANPALKIDPQYLYLSKYEAALRPNGLANGVLPGAPYGSTVLYLVSMPESPADRLSLATLQGLAAAGLGEHILIRDGAYEHYLPYISNGRVSIEEKDDEGNDWTLATLISRYRGNLNGYILCDNSATSESAGVAISLAHHLNAVVVTAENVQLATDAGLECVIDVTDKNDAWLRASQYFALMDKSLAVEQAAIDAPGLIDYAVMTGCYYYYFSGNDAYLHAQQFKFLDGGAHILLGSGTQQYIRAQSLMEIGLNPMSAQSISNLSTLSGCAFTATSLGKYQSEAEKTENVHTVCFVMVGDGNPDWMINDMATGKEWYASELRGDVAVTWGLSDTLYDLAPPLLTYMGHTATENDDFILSPGAYSGGQTSGMHSLDMTACANNMILAMRHMLLSYVQLNDYDPSLINLLMSDAVVRGIACTSSVITADAAGEIEWISGKPLVMARHRMTISAVDGTVEAIAESLNAASTDVSCADGYSLVVIDVSAGIDEQGNMVDGGDTMAAVQKLVSLLDDDVQAVTVAEFMARINANVE